MRDRVTVEAMTESQDAMGEVAQTWAALETVWADVQPRTGREFYTADKVHEDITHLVTIRHHATVDSSMRLKVDGRTLNIGTVLNMDGKRVRTQLLCTERKAGG